MWSSIANVDFDTHFASRLASMYMYKHVNKNAGFPDKQWANHVVNWPFYGNADNRHKQNRCLSMPSKITSVITPALYWAWYILWLCYGIERFLWSEHCGNNEQKENLSVPRVTVENSLFVKNLLPPKSCYVEHACCKHHTNECDDLWQVVASFDPTPII